MGTSLSQSDRDVHQFWAVIGTKFLELGCTVCFVAEIFWGDSLILTKKSGNAQVWDGVKTLVRIFLDWVSRSHDSDSEVPPGSSFMI